MIYYNMHEPQKHAKFKKPSIKHHILYNYITSIPLYQMFRKGKQTEGRFIVD